MKRTITSTLFLAALLIFGVEQTAHAQAKPASAPRYKDAVGENPTADADIQVVAAYLN